MSELTLLSQYEVDPMLAAVSMHDFVAAHKSPLHDAGFLNLINNYEEREVALHNAVERRQALQHAQARPYIIYDEHMKIGVASILPALELLGPANSFTAQLPRVVQKRLTRYSQQVIVPAEQSVNIALFISPDYIADADGMAGHQVVRRLTQEARTLHAGKTAWALIDPQATAFGNNREASYLRGGYAQKGIDRYDDHEPRIGRLPLMKLVTMTL